MKPRRVAVTGIGAITPIGTGRDGFWAGMRTERSAVQTIDRFDPSIFRSHNAGQVNDFRAEDHIEAKRARRSEASVTPRGSWRGSSPTDCAP